MLFDHYIFNGIRNTIDDFMSARAIDYFYLQEDMPALKAKFVNIIETKKRDLSPKRFIKTLNPQNLVTGRFLSLFTESQPDMKPVNVTTFINQIAGKFGFIKKNKEIGCYEAEGSLLG